MATTMDTNYLDVSDCALQHDSQTPGIGRRIGDFVEKYLYPEIRNDDNRIAEYIPPVPETGAQW